MKFRNIIPMVLLSAVISCSAVYAACDAVTQIEYKPLENVYTVKGYLDGETRGNIGMGLRIIYQDGSYAWTSTAVANRDGDGKVCFEFEPVALSETVRSGTYSFEITSFVSNPYTEQKKFLTNPDKLALMQELDKLTGTAYSEKLESEGDKLGADISVFSGLSALSKSRVSQKLSKIKSGLENVTVSDFDYVQKTNVAVDTFLNNYNKFTATEAFNECDSADDVKNWISKYTDKYELKKDNEKLWTFYENENVSGKANDILSQLSDMNTMEEIKGKLCEAILCSEIHFSHVSNIDNLLDTYKSVLGIDLSGYNSLSDKTSVRNGLIGTTSYTYDTVRTLFNNLVSAQKANESRGGGSGSVGGSGSDGGLPYSGVKNDTETNETAENPFRDVSGSHWAKNYILKLYKKSILSGKTADLFEPDSYITRAEIIKIIVGAFNIRGVSGKTFNDISGSEWFAEYVLAAAGNNIVAGDENGNMNPNSFVTRQDAAVMLYRAMKINANAAETSFADYESIAQYARPAVNYYAAKRVISGYPNGSFAPHKNLTRAETAKIVAALLN